jgi:hypothetical protein
MKPLWQKREICGYLMGFGPVLPSFPGVHQREPRMCNGTSGNLALIISGLRVRRILLRPGMTSYTALMSSLSSTALG